MNSTIKPKPCKTCQSPYHSAMWHKPRKPIAVKTPLPRPTKRIKQQSDKEKEYQVWKETVARPYLIERDGNKCACCKRPAYSNEKLDIEHTKGKGSHPELKRELTNLRLYCRFPCHANKTNEVECSHV
jgi:hypothetical protein